MVSAFLSVSISPFLLPPSLIRRIKQANRVFSEAQIWTYFEQMVAGLRHMHQRRVMHRDIKPANLMLTLDNVLKLGDLGLGRFLTSQACECEGEERGRHRECV